MIPDFTMKLEVVPIPVADIDRAIEFYVQKAGFNLDHDVTPAKNIRVAQLTPPGSGCSIVIATGVGEFDDMHPGTIRGVHLIVENIEVARAALVKRGMDIAEVVDMGGIKYAAFSDPDNNTWTLQEIAVSE